MVRDSSAALMIGGNLSLDGGGLSAFPRGARPPVCEAQAPATIHTRIYRRRVAVRAASEGVRSRRPRPPRKDQTQSPLRARKRHMDLCGFCGLCVETVSAISAPLCARRLRICCFAGRGDNLLMHAHYAGQQADVVWNFRSSRTVRGTVNLSSKTGPSISRRHLQNLAPKVLLRIVTLHFVSGKAGAGKTTLARFASYPSDAWGIDGFE